MKRQIPANIRQTCQPRLISAWLRAIGADQSAEIQYKSGDILGHQVVLLSNLEPFLQDNAVEWADLTGDISVGD